MHESIRSGWFALAAVLILSVVLNCGIGGGAEGEKEVVVVGYLPIIAHLPALIAQQEGYLEEVAVEFRVFGNSNDLLSALLGSEIDVATTVAVAPVVAQESVRPFGSEPKIRIFSYSATSTQNPFDSLFVSPDSNLGTPSDLEGGSIGVFPGTTAKNILGYWLRNVHRVDTDAITWVPLPPSLQLDSLLNGDIDALYTYEPIRTVALESGARMIYGSVIGSVLNDAPYGASAINVEFENTHPAAARAFIDAFDRGIEFVRSHPADSRVVLRKELGLAEDVAANCNLEDRLTSAESVRSENVARLRDFIDLLERIGEIHRTVEATRLLGMEKEG